MTPPTAPKKRTCANPASTGEFLAAREITLAAERGSDEISPGDVGGAINGYRSVVDHVLESRAGGELGAGDSEQPE